MTDFSWFIYRNARNTLFASCDIICVEFTQYGSVHSNFRTFYKKFKRHNYCKRSLMIIQRFKGYPCESGRFPIKGRSLRIMLTSHLKSNVEKEIKTQNWNLWISESKSPDFLNLFDWLGTVSWETRKTLTHGWNASLTPFLVNLSIWICIKISIKNTNLIRQIKNKQIIWLSLYFMAPFFKHF